MSRKKAGTGDRAPVQLPKDALKRVKLGQSFAEYDFVLAKHKVYVRTNALAAAEDASTGRCFFVGRRGTGKTAITKYLSENYNNTIVINPEIFSLFDIRLGLEELSDAKQRPFRSLVSAFRRSLEIEVLKAWRRDHRLAYDRAMSDLITSELERYGALEFDSRTLQLIALLARPLQERDDPTWLNEVRVAKALGNEMAQAYEGRTGEYTVVIDSIDDSWDGSPQAVFFLAALMHACLEMSVAVPWTRAMVFLRENIFERVREIDSEFSRLETCVVGLDWTDEQLLEMVERRLNVPFNTKIALGGQTFERFFEQPDTARKLIFEYCQQRPRDVLTYCDLAISTAQSHNHDVVELQDLLDARRRFSDGRLKDLGDEYSENYPQLAVVLSKFYGLGRRWSLSGVAALIQQLLADTEVKALCGSWLYEYTAPELFIRLMYNIGFFGITTHRGAAFRSLGPRDTTPPPVTSKTDILVHPSYWDSLDLQDVIVGNIDAGSFKNAGLVSELPGGIDLSRYHEELGDLLAELETLPTGQEHAARFEEVVGEIVRLCFFRALGNVEAKSRSFDGRVIRDWVASNRATGGFWELMRHRYNATQVIWECKNYKELGSSDFHQTAYYVTPQGGRLVLMAFRGEVKPGYYEHVRRIATDKDGIVLLLGERDLKVFVRQAMHGKIKEDHIQEILDRTQRAIT